jgi:choline dehydrogenase-like flavoprotein
MPTEGTSNPTLTMAALTFRAAESINKALQGRRS